MNAREAGRRTDPPSASVSPESRRSRVVFPAPFSPIRPIFSPSFVLKHIISLARDLGFVCLAEGAERKEQVERLSQYGCDLIQGYYYSKPMSIEEFEKKYY